jgi:hypothetical protein
MMDATHETEIRTGIAIAIKTVTTKGMGNGKKVVSSM